MRRSPVLLVSLALLAALVLGLATRPAPASEPLSDASFTLAGITVTAQVLLMVTAAIVLSGLLFLYFQGTVTGKNVTATNAYRDSDTSARSGPLVTICGEGTEGSSCSFSDNAQTVYVGTSSTGGVPENHAFYVAVF